MDTPQIKEYDGKTRKFMMVMNAAFIYMFTITRPTTHKISNTTRSLGRFFLLSSWKSGS